MRKSATAVVGFNLLEDMHVPNVAGRAKGLFWGFTRKSPTGNGNMLGHFGVRWLATALVAPSRPCAPVVRFRSPRLLARTKAVASYRTPRRVVFGQRCRP